MIDDLDDERFLQLEECAQMAIEDNDSKYIHCHKKMDEICRETQECAQMYREDITVDDMLFHSSKQNNQIQSWTSTPTQI
jgi:hypothetical protein